MEDKGILAFLRLTLLMVCVSVFSAAERTQEKANCDRGNDLLIPSNVSCIYYNFHTMNCIWSLGMKVDNNTEKDNSCSYEISNDESVQMYFDFNLPPSVGNNQRREYIPWRSCPDQTPTSCTFNHTFDFAPRWFSVKVAVRNRKLNSSSEITMDGINVLDIGKPTPVTNFTVSKTRDPVCRKILWNLLPHSDGYTCILTSTAKCTRKRRRFVVVYNVHTDETKYPTICDFHPSTVISLSVSCRYTIKIPRKIEVGYWSDNVTVSERLDSDVPYVAPNTTEGLYEFTSASTGKFKSINLYFTPLNECDLHDDPFRVAYLVTVDGYTVHAIHPKFVVYSHINIPDNKGVNISLQAINSAGPSLKSRVVTIFPEMIAPKSSKLSIEYHSTKNKCEAAITPMETSLKFSYLFHTLVWCKGLTTSCMVPLKWVVIRTNGRKLHKYPCNLRYRYGLITHGYNIMEGRVTSTGIHWFVTRSLTYATRDKSSEKELRIDGASVALVVITILPLICAGALIIRDTIKSRPPESRITSQSGNTTIPSNMHSRHHCDTEELLQHSEGCTQTNREGTLNTWKKCIDQKSEDLAAKLLHDNILPTDNELQFISSIFGPSCKTLKNACAKICEAIEQKLENVDKVWPARTISSNRIVFVVESNSTLSNANILGYEIHSVNCHNSLEKECEKVMLKEKEILASYDENNAEEFMQLKESISKKAIELMNDHSNITVISPSVVKSVGYSTPEQHKLTKKLCISIYVEKKVKGLIPLEGKQIPEDICGFPTDVLEGTFSLFCNGPNDYQRTVKMGCGIHAGVQNDQGDILCGTLGGFVEHETHGLCCFTCAHLILSKEELPSQAELTSQPPCNITYARTTGKSIYQPVSKDSSEFGRLVSAAFKLGLDGSPGVEVALIKVLRRIPTSGSFPSFPQADTGSNPKETFVFNSGSVFDTNQLRPMTEVYKFGMATGPTIGKLGLPGAVVNDPNFGIRLLNQLVVYPEKTSSFAAFGDSGALVFIGHTDPATAAAIGIVEGGFKDGRTFITPLLDVLKALKCPKYLKRFENSSDSGVYVNMPQGAAVVNVEEEMDWKEY